MRRTSRQWNYVTRSGSHRPRRTIRIPDIESELAFEDVIDLAGTMSVNYWRTAPRWHPDFDGEQVAVRLSAGREDRDLVQSELSIARRVSVLAERAQMTKQAMAELVQHLETHGYVVRVPDPTDRRAKLVQPTERGLEVFTIAQELVPELENRIRQVIGADRLQALQK
ncbi:MAG TPA: MarR family transcriptional regulator [Propionibacteriaceae bacterium]